jgi:DNA invertase Pin-like site-specific DNA recombinase
MPGDRVVIFLRVSHHNQRRRGNLNDQEAKLRRAMAKLGVVVVYVYHHVGSGWDCDAVSSAAAIAREHGAKLVAESVSRFIRHPDYHSKSCPDAQADAADLQGLRNSAPGVILVTLLHPDASAAEERSFQRKRGQSEKDKKGGRPPKGPAREPPRPPGYKRQRRLEWLAHVLALAREKQAVRAISAETGMAKSTVADWLAKYGKEDAPGRS